MMIKDKIIEMENGKSYYVLTDVIYNNKKYLLALECDLEKDDVKEDEYLIMELSIDGDDLSIKTVNDNNTALIVTNMLMNKIRNEE